MKKTITIIILSFLFLAKLYCQTPSVVLDNIKWEALDGPTGYATGFAKSGNRLFAKPHFYSDDLGESWHKLPDFFNPAHLAASDEAVLIHQIENINYFVHVGTGENRTEAIYTSNDYGDSFQKNLSTYTGKSYRTNTVFSDIAVKNDKVFCFTRFNTGQGVGATLFYTSDAGVNWDSTYVQMKGQLSATQDTAIVVNVNNYGDTSDWITVNVYGNDDFSNPRIDTLPKDLVGRNDKALFVNGLYHIAKFDTLAVYNPQGKSSIEYSFDSLNIGQFEYIDGLFYFSNKKGLFTFHQDNPTDIDTLYASPSPEGWYIPFGIFDNIWLIHDDGDVQRSFDQGATWERKSRGINNVYGKMELIDDRFCINGQYSSPAVDSWSFNNPPTGTPQGDGNVSGQIFTYGGDTLVKFEGQTRLESIDAGLTWDSLHFTDVGFGNIFENRDTFVTYYYNGFSSSVDRGKTWTRHPHYIRNFWWIGNHQEYTKIQGMFNGLLILNLPGATLISKDYGANWGVFADLPFGRTIGDIATINTSFLPGAKRYFYKDNYLYAFQDGYGLWRTPFGELENALRGIEEGSDLQLTMTSKETRPKLWTNFSINVTIENVGTLPNDNIVVHVPKPDEVVFQGRNEYQVSKGDFEFWQIQEWKVGSLEPGESATLTLNYFRIDDEPFNSFAQVISADELDLDSSPNNGSCCTISEDDEAVLEFGAAPPNVWNRSSSSQEQQFDVAIYPNPFIDELNFKIQSKIKDKGQIQITDFSGRTLASSIIDLEIGHNTKIISAQNLPQGVFVAKFSNSKNESQSIQIFKLR